VVSGPAATMVHLAAIFAAELERRGVASPFIYFAPLARSATHSIHTVGAALRAWPIANPPRTDAETSAAVTPVVADLTRALSATEAEAGVRRPPHRERVAVTGSRIFLHKRLDRWSTNSSADRVSADRDAHRNSSARR
jgi:hypothetical protein